MTDYREFDRAFHEWPSVNVRVRRDWQTKTYEAEVSFGSMGALPMEKAESFYAALGKAIKYARRLNAAFKRKQQKGGGV